jgi:hypothetical protein
MGIEERFGNGYVRHLDGYGWKIGSKYVGWNSFKSSPYFTNKDHAEIFQSEESAIRFKQKHQLGDSACLVGLLSEKEPQFVWHQRINNHDRRRKEMD